MRKYSIDSTEAMARIVAVTCIANGALDHSEVEALEKHRTSRRSGPSRRDP